LRSNADPEVTAKTISSVVAQLPNRIVCDRLIDEFFKLDFILWLFAVAHRPSFEPSYRALWYYAPASPFTMGNNTLQAPEPPKTLSISFVANVCMMLALSLQFLPDDLSYLTGGNTTAMKEQMYLAARHALIQSEIQEAPDRARAETVLMFGVYAKNEGDAGQGSRPRVYEGFADGNSRFSAMLPQRYESPRALACTAPVYQLGT
jgi:hypothetical protein